jgi:hypothetical protein
MRAARALYSRSASKMRGGTEDSIAGKVSDMKEHRLDRFPGINA